MSGLNGKSLPTGTSRSIFIDFTGVLITYASLPQSKPLIETSGRSEYFRGVNIIIEFSVGFARIFTLRVYVMPSKKEINQQ